MGKPNIVAMGEAIVRHIREDKNATTDFGRDVEMFLRELPEDLGKGSLNGWRTQLANKCCKYLSS